MMKAIDICDTFLPVEMMVIACITSAVKGRENDS